MQLQIPDSLPPLPEIFSVKVTPKAKRTEYAGQLADGTLKIRVSAPPEDGKANRAVLAFLEELYRLPRGSLKIVSGATATRKRVRRTG